MKKITIWKEDDNFGAEFHNDDKLIWWDDLTRKEQIDLVNACASMSAFFQEHIKSK